MGEMQIGAEELGINSKTGKESDVFKWFVASYWFGKPVQQQVSRRTWEKFMEHGVDTPRKISSRTWQELVDILTERHYRRLDESIARNLQDACQYLVDEYDGKISNMKDVSTSQQDFEERLKDLQGVGPKTVEIFMREIQPAWVS